MNAKALERALDNLDSNLAATQLGITISSLALGWIGEPAIAHLIEPVLAGSIGSLAGVSAYAIAVALSFVLITALHIVLGELAPKSLALQRSEGTALWVVRPLGLFRWLLSPAIVVLNGLGNLVLRLFGLQSGTGEASLHSTGELKLLVAESQEAGLLQEAQEEVVVRALDIGNRRDRRDHDAAHRSRLDRRRRRSRGNPEDHPREPPRAAPASRAAASTNCWAWWRRRTCWARCWAAGRSIRRRWSAQPLLVHEAMPIFKVLEQFKQAPVRLAVVVDEYGGLEGIVTQADLLEALAGDLPELEGEQPDIVERDDGALLIDGMAPVHGIFDRLGLQAAGQDPLPHHRGLRAGRVRSPARGGRVVHLRGLALRGRRHGWPAHRQAAGEPACAVHPGGVSVSATAASA